MGNPFKEILTNEKVPEILRDKVVNDINFIKLSLDMADLFVVKYPSVVKEFFEEDVTPNVLDTPKTEEDITQTPQDNG